MAGGPREGGRWAAGVRLGLIVPSSNVTMERELPAMPARRERAEPDWLQRDRVRLERDGPGMAELRAALPARLFAAA